MKIVFLTTDEPFYLPAFFEEVFSALAQEHQFYAVIVPPVYKGTTRLGLAIRYAKTFGLYEAGLLFLMVSTCKLMDLLPLKQQERHYSLGSVFSSYGIEYVRDADINGPENLERIRNWGAELAISISCPQIFKKELIKLPPLGCLNLHGALLPKYRGVMPSFWMLKNKEELGGLTLFFVNEAIDAGDILVQRKFPILAGDTLDSFIKKSKKIGAQMVIDGIGMIEKGAFKTTPIEISGGSYFGWPTRRDVLEFLGNGRKFR